MTAGLVSKTLAPTRKSLRDAGLATDEVKGVVMVGGSTRMPCIRQAVADFFKQTPADQPRPDKVVALAPPCRPTCWPATAPATTGCCSM